MPYRPRLVSSTTRPTISPLVQQVFGFGGTFDPLALNPYAFFDGESYKGTLENPTLDLDPSNPDSLDVITATRLGVATYTDSSGLIQSASPDTVRVDYTQGAELTPTKYQNIGYTDFSQVWTPQNNGTSATDGGGYNGNPSKVVEALNTYGSYGYQVPTQDGVTYCLSLYVKRLSGSGAVRLTAYSASGTTTFDITSSLTSEFTRVTAVFEGRSGGGDVRVGIQDYGSGDMEVEIAMPQVEEGTTASSFVANTTGSPKFITGATYGPRVPMILVEPSATNTIRWSESSSAYSYGTGITTESTEVLAPNGQASAFKMTPNDTSTMHRWGVLNGAGSWNANDVITYSVWIKTDGYDYILNIGGFFGGEAATFDTLDGSVIGSESNVISASSEDYGNGWFRYVVTYTFQNTITNNYVYAGIRLYKRDASGNATNWDAAGETTGVLVYGSQFESGSVATSYIPTDNDISGVTRAADEISIDGTAFTDFFNTGGDGTFYLELVPTDILKTIRLLTGYGGSSSELILYTNNNSSQVQSWDGTNGENYGPAIDSQVNRIAFSYSSTAMKGSINGASEQSENHDGSFSGKTSIYLGRYTTVPIHYKRLIYWPYHSDSL